MVQEQEPTRTGLDLREVQVAPLVVHNGVPKVSIKPALDAAGLANVVSLRYHRFDTEGEAGDVLLATGLDVAVDGRADKHARQLYQDRLAAFPPADLADVLGITREMLDGEEPVRLQVLIGDLEGEPVLAFRRAATLAVDVDGLDDD